MKFIHRRCKDPAITELDDNGDDLYSTVYVRCVLYNNDGDPVENTVSCSQFTLLNLIQNFTDTLDMPADHYIELYSQEGYPLHNNDITNHGIV